VLLNAATGRWHPVAFTAAPLPGGVQTVAGFMRFRSRAHHTEGFATEREADEHIASTPGWVPSGVAWEWDGRAFPR